MDPIRRCVQQLARLPGIGEKTAWRLTWWLLRADDELVTELSEAIGGLKEGVVECGTCCTIASSSPCSTCSDTRRDPALICVVERPQDVVAIEGSGDFRGFFHVLHGSLSPLDGIGPDQLRIRPLLARLDGVQEVILATDPDVEGDATALYLARVLKPLGLKVSRLAYGISVGTEIEYADRVSLMRALENRRPL
ncbi:MAG: recombination protein RecR [Proteobacteria bacterium]|nr:recombination protein RecR [Pseudomonadota bacterium]MCP4915646.1 recombination protein RecR [Pseudomonadota bacterium]